MRYLLLLLLLITSALHAQIYKPKKITALLGAFDLEVELLKKEMGNPRERVIHGIKFYVGEIGGHRVVVAETGIGKVNAAMTTSLLLREFRPQRVVFTGIAGGLRDEQQQGDIVIATQTMQYDFGALTNDKQTTNPTRNPITKQRNPLYYPADSALLTLAKVAAKEVSLRPLNGRVPFISTGIVVTGDLFVSSENKVNQLRQEFNGDATEMEGGAVAQVCFQQQVPHLIIRSLSDKADSKAHQSIADFGTVAANNSANLLISFLRKLPK